MKFETKFKIQDYIGKEINYFTVIGENDQLAKDGSRQWDFRCVCGNVVTTTPYKVISGHKKSCGCMRYKNITHKEHNRENLQKVDAEKYIGRKNGKLTVVGYVKPSGKGRLKLECICDCGNTTYVLPYQFESGVVQSCGCLRGDAHGLSKNPLYGLWFQMVTRCHNPNSKAYKHYGARGIYVCDEWRKSPQNFIDWVEKNGGRPPKTTLDRIDNNGPYAPCNCRWASSDEQQRNKRDNVMLTLNGETKCLADWSNEIGINSETIRERLKHGWTAEEALTTPASPHNKKHKAAP